jgi:lipoate-protein ligase A
MKLYNLGLLPGFDSMTVFHAMAYAGEEGLVIVSPAEPIVSLGFFQRAETSVNRAYCQEKGLGLIRREVGGGTTLLDRNQVFYQLVFRADDPRFAAGTLDLYRQLSQPVIDTYADLGVAVRFKEVNDLVTVNGSRKISGEGGCNIGAMKVFVGSVIIDFDCATMSHVFPSRDETVRLQLLQGLESGMSTVLKETGAMPPRDRVIEYLTGHFAQVVGSLEPAALPPGILEQARQLEKTYTSEDFIAKAGRKAAGIKIKSGVEIHENMVKAVGGRVFSVCETHDDLIGKVRLYGDFTFLPKEKLAGLEKSLQGLPRETAPLAAAAAAFLANEAVDCPGVTAADFAAAVAGLA